MGETDLRRGAPTSPALSQGLAASTVAAGVAAGMMREGSASGSASASRFQTRPPRTAEEERRTGRRASPTA